MTRNEMVAKVAHIRGFEDKYTLIIANYAERKEITDKQVLQMMFDILMGIGYEEEEQKNCPLYGRLNGQAINFKSCLWTKVMPLIVDTRGNFHNLKL